MNRTSLVAVGIVGGSLTLMVGNYDPDLTMLFATVLLLAFGIVTPAQGKRRLPPILRVVLRRARLPQPEPDPEPAQVALCCMVPT